ncbi:hypothetical protein HanXRQr2_Chr04g0179981 [Helianthus annuus]|uniref:Uncharacterized protein n=1 Tax=Helianthus annuus TaxID=4232 RepID=A0A9K3NSV8_HELAN|nr:hypothetical protein HanXRQr2_Chr04g0179981 [Helianthus annuus]KAJ0932420.1 hypothetical protein HanPSC8_Chr04g0173441 [Helianthus annuus]
MISTETTFLGLFPISPGMLPVSLFVYRFKRVRFLQRPISLGICPERKFSNN